MIIKKEKFRKHAWILIIFGIGTLLSYLGGVVFLFSDKDILAMLACINGSIGLLSTIILTLLIVIMIDKK